MSERKVLNKYYPPDFDPSKIPRRSGPKNSQQVVRLMAPFSMRCNTCGEYVNKGKKFNARKETVEGETYYGIKIFRFYIKCTLCSAEITFKTDPKNTDYLAEHGASRNFEPWRDEKAEEEDRLVRMEEEENNPMKALENRTTDSKREMDILDALQDLRSRNAKHERVGGAGLDNVIDKVMAREEELDPEELRRLIEAEEDEKLVREVFAKIPTTPAAGSSTPVATPSSSKLSREDAGSDDDGDASDPDTPATSILSTPTVTLKRKAGPQPSHPSLSSEVVNPLLSKPPVKRKKPNMANSLGIKLVKGKGKAKV